MGEWTLEITLRGESFKLVQQVGDNIFKQILAAGNHRELPIAGAGTGGYSYNVRCVTPVEQQIMDLRRNADELEEKLRAGVA